MDCILPVKWRVLVIASFTLGLSLAYWKRRNLTSDKLVNKQKMAAAEVDNSLQGSELIKSMEQMKIEQQPRASQPPANEEIENFDRDSANHSPSDFLSGNHHSDTHSESSNDSGKGGSDCANANGDGEHARYDVMTPPLSPANGSSSLIPLPERLFVYEFEIPQTLCGLLIGRYGAYVNHIKVKTGASLLIKKHPSNRRYKICAVEGTKSEIDAALAIIRAKFPLKRYPHLTLNQINVAPPSAVAVVPDSIQLQLPPEVSCDVVVSAMVGPNHIFLQQITHPTYSSLTRLDLCMAQCYNEIETPNLPRPIQPSMVCAAPSLDGWYRAKVIAVYPLTSYGNEDGGDVNQEATSDEQQKERQLEKKESTVNGDEDCDVDICFVDYGGYARVPASSLRQIRADFMSLPFQGVECLLANVTPIDEENGWSVDAYSMFEDLTTDRILQAQLVGYSLEGVPMIHLYYITQQEAVLINRELVTRGVAQWVEPQLVAN